LIEKKGSFSLKVIVLGSGSCVPSCKRYPASYFFYPEGLKENWIIDIGEGALFRLNEAGESYKEIDRIFISHTHPDHIGALVPLILALKYTPGFKRSKPLFIYGPDKVWEYLKIHLDFASYLKCDFSLKFISCSDGSEVKIGDCFVKTKNMEHFEPTIGFRWSIGDKIVVYGADGALSDSLIELSRNADLLILESSYVMNKPSPGHLTTFEAGKVANEAGAKRLLLSHFYPEVAGMDEEEVEAQVRTSGYEGKITVAKDLMTLEI
jgi:ribonuclease BN (tRNA processing enzyme)